MPKTSIPAFRLGIDLGGTKICAVVIDHRGRICGRAKRSTKAERGYLRVLERIIRTGTEALEDAAVPVAKIRKVGIGVPGPVDADRRRLIMAKNLGWDDKPLAADIGRLVKRPVVLGNDVNCGAIGEIAYGAARKVQSAILAFVGTGLGGALVLEGRTISGFHGFGGELGHMPTPFSRVTCSCGQTGCLETVASKRGIARLITEAVKSGKTCKLAAEADQHMRASDLAIAWKAGCPATRQALKLCSEALALGLATVGSVFDPEVIVLGGGVMEAMGKKLLPGIASGMRSHCVLYRRHPPVLKLAALGDDAVAVGAAILSGQGKG